MNGAFSSVALGKCSRQRNEPFDSLDFCCSNLPGKRSSNTDFYPPGLNDNENMKNHRKNQVYHKRTVSNTGSHRNSDSGKESLATTPESVYKSREPFYLHEPNMTCNDRVKRLFEQDRRKLRMERGPINEKTSPKHIG